MFSHPRVGLAQVDAGLPGQLDQPLARPMHQTLSTACRSLDLSPARSAT
jgi:hypothetical protein